MFKLKTTLYQHQQAAFNKLKHIRVGGLFMEMGTGKTRTAIEFVYYRQRKISNVIWFCPVTLKQTIYNELIKHTTLEDIYVFDDASSISNIPTTFWYIVGIESISSSSRVVLTVNKLITESSFCIVDESSFIKTHNSYRTMRITKMCVRAKYKMLLTGTPLTLGIVDLYAQMKFLSSKILGYNSFYSFAANHLEYSEKYPGLIVRAHKIDYITRKINPYIYQVKKSECLDLPEKIYKFSSTYPTTQQTKWYNQAKADILLNCDELDSYTLFKLFGALQQIASGFWNGSPIGFIEIRNNRLSLLETIITSIPQAEKIIVWCKYVYSVKRITKAFDCNLVYGEQSEKERNQQLESFKDNGKILVITMQCGGYGLDLSFVNHVIFYENSFNYAHRQQAEDRCHRIGQINNVIYFDLSCGLNIENYIERNMTDKGRIIRNFKQQIDKIKDDNQAIKEFIKQL